jgi:hypothetical protein
LPSFLAAHALAYRLTQRHDAAFIAGLSFGFGPYRVAQWPHLQMLWSCWMPLGLLALHKYVADRRTRDLLVFALAWVLGSLTCGYYLMYFSVLVGLWVCWFAPSPRAWLAVGLAMAAAALPMAPLLSGYQRIQASFGLSRGMGEIEKFGADLTAMWASAQRMTLSSHWTFAPRPEGELYPGAVVLIIAIAGAVIAWRKLGNPGAITRARIVLLISAIAMIALAVCTEVSGGWTLHLGPIDFSSHRPYRIATVAIWLGVAFVVLDPRMRDGWRRRSTLLFYLVATVAMLTMALGPVGRVFGDRFLWRAPYSWLMLLPGGGALRVPARFGMLFALCLGQAAAMGWTKIVSRAARRSLVLVVALAVVADGWASMSVVAVPRPIDVAALAPAAVLIELPMPDLYADTQAMLNATAHGHTLVNGFSGYSPPHYAPLVGAAEAMDARMFDVLREERPLGIYVDPARDAGDAYRKFVETQPGIERLPSSTGALFVLPAFKAPEPAGLRQLPIAAIVATITPDDARKMMDGDPGSAWGTQRAQNRGDIVTIDLGAAAGVSRLVLEQGRFAGDYPRRLRIDVSDDAASWITAWEGPTAARLMASAIHDPTHMSITIDLAAPATGRYVRLVCMSDRLEEAWSVAEVRVFGR